jgi:hypothetical protein
MPIERTCFLRLRAAALQAVDGRLIRLFSEEDGNVEPEATRAFCRRHVCLVSSSLGLRPKVTIFESALRREFGRNASHQLERVLVADGFSVDFAIAT